MRILILQNDYEYLSRINFVSITRGGCIAVYTSLCAQNLCLLYFSSQTCLVMCISVKIVLNKAKLL